MVPRIAFLASVVLAGALVGCDRPECTNTNPIFEQEAPGSVRYNEELLAQVDRLGPDGVRYWIDTWEDLDGEQFLWVYVQGDGLCAKAVLELHGEDRSEGMTRNSKNAGGSHGAEVIGLHYAVERSPGRTVLVYEGRERIID